MSERRPYLRSASLEKIRCSAYYSIQLAGEFDEIDVIFCSHFMMWIFLYIVATCF